MSRFPSHPLSAVTIGALFCAELALAAFSSSLAAQEKGPAELVLRNGVVVTVDGDQPQAQAVAARGGLIVAVGDDAKVKLLIGPKTRVIDLKGRLALPGFIEGHGHLTGLGEARLALDLSQARDWEEVVTLVARQAKQTPAGQWVIGDGWHQGRWVGPPKPNVEGYPLHEALSRATPDHPVLLKHATGHMCFANARAMELAGIDRATPDPVGGTILRDQSRSATGAFRETAQDAIYRAQARSQAGRSRAESLAETRRAIELAVDECLTKGVTSFQDAGSSFATIDLFKQLADERNLKLRLWVMVRGESTPRLAELLPAYRLIGYGDQHLTVRAIKRMVDGALGSHGAWLFQPYDDLPGSTGLIVESLDSIRETALLAVKHDYQLCTHAIGDRANHEILELYDTVFRSHPGNKDRRWRIEHAQHIAPADFPRFAELGVIASMQGNHATSDGPFVVARLGKERGGAESYAWRSLLDYQAVVINGTDVPVEDVNPILSFHASVTRRMRDGRLFFPEQCMTRSEALRSYTRDAAYAAFEEDVKGTLSVGKLADVVVLSRNITTIPADEIPAARVDFTIVGGQVVYERSDFAR
jgi:predicted amidohydrolase YtcJ